MHYRSLARRVGDAVRLAEVVQILVKHGFADLIRRLGLNVGLPAKILRTLHLLDTSGTAPDTMGTRLNRALTELGPTFIKLGQIMSTRPDLVGPKLAKELDSLQDRVKTLPFDEMRSVMEASLAKPMDELFSEFNEEPVASASLSQVYRARLKDGPEVAVKVQRPGIRDVILSDVSLLLAVAEWVEENVEDFEWLDAVGTVKEFERTILRELDFSIEARNIERFRENFAEVGYVEIPTVYQQACSAQVLTVDWVDGVRLDETGRFKERKCDPKILARRGCESVCLQVFEHHFFHADPHPGNIWVTYSNRLAFLDYGMVGHLERPDVVALGDLLYAVFKQDAKGVVQTIPHFAENADIDDVMILEREVGDYITFEAEAIIAGGEVGKALEKIADVLNRHKLRLSPRFSLLIKALGTVESAGKNLDPELDTLPIIQPYVERMVRERFYPSQILADIGEQFVTLVRIGKEFPIELHQLMMKATKGKLRVHLDHHGLEKLSHVVDHASNRLSFSIVTGSLIVGSSLLMTTGTGETLGLIGYSIAGLLGLGLIISILRSRRY